MAKGIVSEATGRQAASFVLGCVATLTVVLLLQQRPEELRSRPTMPVQFMGWRGRNNATSPVITGGGGAAAGGNRTSNATTAAPTRSLPPSSADHKQEVNHRLFFLQSEFYSIQLSLMNCSSVSDFPCS